MLQRPSTTAFNVTEDDFDRAVEWYSEALGVPPYFSVPGFAKWRTDVGGELGIGAGGHAPEPTDEMAITSWSVPDLPHAFERLLALGATQHHPIEERGGGFATAAVVDPFGNVLGLIRNANLQPFGPPLTGALVSLRNASRADIPALAAIRATPEVVEHWREGPDFAAAVEEGLAEEGTTKYVIEVDGRVVGWLQWQAEEEPDYRHASMDIYLDPAVHGRGIGTDALRTVARHLFDDQGHHRITIDPAAHNAAAIACYTKVGFQPVGTLRQAERGPDGTFHDSLLMDLLPEDLTRAA
jgi:aminoglycoside 6'-N-acetyltransferase